MCPSLCLTVGDADVPARLDSFCSAALPHISREKVKRAIQNGHCYIQEQGQGNIVRVPSTRLATGQVIHIDIPEPESVLIPEQGNIAPLWHDTDILVLNKPAGITVHPCPSCPAGTLVQRIAASFPQLLTQEGVRPGIVHRLDKDTSGLLLIALTEHARLALSTAFADRAVHKEYLALVRGVPPTPGVSHAPLGRDPTSRVKMAVLPPNHSNAKPAHTEWRVLYADPLQRFALVRVTLHTGRTHQIRLHMAHAGHPILGDTLYGPRGEYCGVSVPRQMLHAFSLSLAHPITHAPLRFVCPPPPDFLETAVACSHTLQRVVLTGLPGCGKSALLGALQERGIPVWSADTVVDSLYAHKGDGWCFLRGRFGERFAPDNAPVDRMALRQAMTEDPRLRYEVEESIHAMTRHNLDMFWKACENMPVAVAEVPLYLEAGWRDKESGVFLVGIACPEETRHARLARDRGWTQERCHTLDAWQWSEQRKMGACDRVLDNGADMSCLNTGADTLLRTLATQGATEVTKRTQRITSCITSCLPALAE